MIVHFIGAGPGAPDLLTLRGAKLINESKMVMYAGSLVSEEILEHCQEGAEIINTAKLNLEEQEACYVKAKENDWDVARIHSGDPSVYGATAEQMQRLRNLEIPYKVVPGVSSFSAAAACLDAELTKPEVSQTIILTRTSGRASSVPEKEALDKLASHQASLCIFLSAPHLPQVVEDLKKHYAGDTPIALVHKATWPEEKIHRSTLDNIIGEVDLKDWRLSTLIMVGDVLRDDVPLESQLYSAKYSHRFRKAEKEKESAE
ncbi:MAG: precorrin-4/cobalt-precorrin-4 C11-methyltransferase [bacterium]|jgi:precorrin-4/cobalt-precorrin-4 C11-methyltransferase